MTLRDSSLLKRLQFLLILTLCLVIFTACSPMNFGRAEHSENSLSMSQSMEDVPETIRELANALYEDVDNIGVTELNAEILMGRFGVDASLSPNWVAFYAAKESYGIADFFIFKLPEDTIQKNTLYQQLSAVQKEREKYFENLDVFGSHEIAKNAQVVQTSGYLYLCMLPDEEASANLILAFLRKQAEK